LNELIILYICRCHQIKVLMYGPRLCNEYIKALDAFIDFAKKDMLDNIRGNICCPCKHCKNEKRYCADDVLRSHLIKHGFM
jgi:hypothetical protein